MIPEALLLTLRGFQDSRVLLTALELDVFSSISQGAATAAAVAERINADSRATEMLLNALVALGVLEKEGTTFRNTPAAAEHFTSSGDRLAMMHYANLWARWSTLTDAVRMGTATLREPMETRPTEWTEAFIAAMDFNARGRAPEVVKAVGAADVRRMLDVGGGSGAYSIAFAQANPELQTDILDVPAVVPIASRHLAAAGLEGRVRVRAGDLRRDDFGRGYNLVFVSAICHMLSVDENRGLLGRCRSALAPGGRIVIQDFVLDEAKTSPKQAALFSLNMLVGTERGASYSEPEYRAWLTESNFHDIRRIDLTGTALLIGTA